jgi:uncharacterized BrkB/YihY/UPF0761 family membrane protein
LRATSLLRQGTALVLQTWVHIIALAVLPGAKFNAEAER